MKKTIEILGLALVLVVAVAIWQNHINSPDYRLRNCTEISDNNGYIGFRCPVRHYAAEHIYIPYGERAQVENLLSPADAGNGSM